MILTYSELRVETADFLGWGRSVSGWSTDRLARLEVCVQSGYRQSIDYAPAPGEVLHYWSFMRPEETLSTEDGKYVYDLPVTYAAMVGDLVYAADQDERRIIKQTTPGMIDRNRAVNDYEGRPYLFALRPKDVEQSTEQRTQIMLYPTADAAYAIKYYYDAKIVDLSDANPYPLGGQAHSETILQSCRDIAAARYKDDVGGPEHVAFLERLRASIEADRRHSPKTIGMNDDGQRVVHTRHGTEFIVTHGSMP